MFPDPAEADEQGLLCYGGDLEAGTLMAAYQQGIFPFFSAGQPILWWSPDPRMVLFPAEFYCSSRLRRRLRQSRFHFSHNEAFMQVIGGCAEPRKEPGNGSWILPEMIDAYECLHQLGHAYSFEVWCDNQLIGGLYGVLSNGVFFAESMFSRQRDASKMAVAKLVEHALQKNWMFIDCQFHTDHLASLGAREIPREEFLSMLKQDK